MLAKDEMVKIAGKRGIRPDQAEKEYLLHICLKNVYSGEGAEEVLFKGGTALRLLYGLNRFSEDLDFSSKMGAGNLRKCFIDAIEKFGEYGIEHEITNDEEFEKSCTLTVRLKGPLYSGNARSCNRIRIDAGYRTNAILGGEWKVVRQPFPDVGVFQVNAMRLEEIFAEKAAALLEREKGRDLYDVWVLMNMGVELDPGLLKKKLRGELRGILGKEKYIRDMEPLVPVVPDYGQVRREVETFLRTKIKMR
jgi:predicted nucleotidyltransferase component of viral defense system